MNLVKDSLELCVKFKMRQWHSCLTPLRLSHESAMSHGHISHINMQPIFTYSHIYGPKYRCALLLHYYVVNHPQMPLPTSRCMSPLTHCADWMFLLTPTHGAWTKYQCTKCWWAKFWSKLHRLRKCYLARTVSFMSSNIMHD